MPKSKAPKTKAQKPMVFKQEPEEKDKVLGHVAELDDVRLVFLGTSEEVKHTYFIGFRNSEGEDMKINLSFSAMNALIDLFNNRFKGDKVPFPHKMVWVQVKEKHRS